MVTNHTTHSALTCNMPLETPPRVAFAAAGVHGMEHRKTRDSYVLPELWAIHLYLSPARLTILGQTIDLRPGDVSLTPQAQRTVYDWNGTCKLLCAHFALPKSNPLSPARVPVVMSVKDDLGAWRDRMEAIIAAHQSPKASAILWTLLWELHDRALRQNPAVHPTLERAKEWIELHLNQAIRVRQLADDLNVSHTYLTLLFHLHEGRTVVAYIRARRTQHARHLLENTTQPIKTIASVVGISNLQRFNKLLRRECGHGPRWFRKRK